MKWKTPLLFLTLPLWLLQTASAQDPQGTQPLLTINGAAITVSNGALLDVRGPILNSGNQLMVIDGELRAHDQIVNDGSSDFSTGTGTIVFLGSSFQAVGGSHPSSFPNVTVDKPAGNLTLNQDVSVEGNLTLLMGGVDLNGNDLILSASSELVGENAVNYVYGTTGKIVISLPLNAPSNYNVGNLGAVVTSNSNLGITTIVRGHEVQSALGAESIHRYYDILPVNNSGLNATLEFRYADHELNGQDEDKFVLYRSNDSGTNWSWGGGTANPGANYVVLSGISSFSRWTVANKDTNPISNIDELQEGQSGVFSVFPNPARLGSPISIGLLPAGEYSLECVDAQGRVAFTTSFSSAGLGGYTEVHPRLPASGTYYLLIRSRQTPQRIFGGTPILIH